MVKRILLMVVICATIFAMGSTKTFAAGRTTLDKYNSSGLCAVTTQSAVSFYAEASKDSLVIAVVPQGTPFVPINQFHNQTENKVYNLVVRSDGAVGWIDADLLKIMPKK